MSNSVMSPNAIELNADRSSADVQTVIRAVYKQVLGNPHMMDSERLTTPESQLADRTFSVREFVRAVGKCSPYRFVELNFMHFLGRPPQSQAEISEHIVRCVAEGYDAEIDSYLDSDEYSNSFGENFVPFNRGAMTEVGQSQVTYNRMFAVDRGPSQISSAVKSSQLLYAVATNSTSKVAAASLNLGGSGDASKKKFKIVVQGSKFDTRRRISTTTYLVSGDNMTPQIQRINRTSGKIVSITEVV
jgi:phycoerythrin-associated linker protein